MGLLSRNPGAGQRAPRPSRIYTDPETGELVEVYDCFPGQTHPKNADVSVPLKDPTTGATIGRRFFKYILVLAGLLVFGCCLATALSEAVVACF